MKINQIWQQIPHGAVVTTAWFAAHGVSADQARKLASSGWLQRVGHGAYSRAGDSLSWESAVFALQSSSESESPSLWPGGQTALALQGFAHYLPLGNGTAHLFGVSATRLPGWLKNADWAGRIAFYADSSLPPSLAGSFERIESSGKAFALTISTPERAILEWVAVTPNALLFSSELVDTFDGLNTLRPRRLQTLLEGCRSVRTKRAFLVLARRAGHAWYRRLALDRLDLGSGKRQLCLGGKLDREFQVTVPEAFTDAH